jgi:hypothetical protein
MAVESLAATRSAATAVAGRRPGTYGPGVWGGRGRVPTVYGRSTMNPVTEALAFRGAAEIAHPGGTLLAHLERVHVRLAEWGARPELRLAGLCHAYYGTDGFAVSLGDRAELTALIGAGAERLVHFYASCDRAFSYAHLAEPGGPFRDRFTGAVLDPAPAWRRDFAELTAANELDIAEADPAFHAEHGPSLLRLFTGWSDLLSDPARQAVRTILA